MSEPNTLREVLADVARSKKEADNLKKAAANLAELEKRVKKAADQIKSSGKQFADAEE